MGTVTAIGDYDPNRWRYTPSTTTTSTVYTVIGGRASITFDTWEIAIAAAMVTARSFSGVKVNKSVSGWVVSWDSPIAYNPYPLPSRQPPYTVTWDNGIGTINKGETA